MRNTKPNHNPVYNWNLNPKRKKGMGRYSLPEAKIHNPNSMEGKQQQLLNPQIAEKQPCSRVLVQKQNNQKTSST
jgi:hypothetical protein